MRWLSSLAFLSLLVCAGTGAGVAQTLTLHARTNLVSVPTLVESKTGEPVFGLTVKDFIIKDNGVEQKRIQLDTDTDTAPMSLVVLVQVGRSAVAQFEAMRGLPTMVDALAGDTHHRIAVVSFDSTPRLLQNFTSNPQAVSTALRSVRPGDGGAAILDAVWYAVDMLQDEPKQNQRAILLISETRDHGSRTPVHAVIQKISSSNTIVYSLTFSPARTEVLNDLKHGGGSGMVGAIFMAVQAFRKNTAAAIPEMTGGEYLRFNNGKGLDGRIGLLANQVHNRYMLSFQPEDPKPGLHVLNVTLKQDIGAKVLARTDYWAEAPGGSSTETPADSPEAQPPGVKP
ncbi:MAG TPA: VWA domain-containing protein [Acidobacteriaceae bacterium]|jgi:VWFA-related protein|nr:VWA domain-containing protein [Acidobacteriaceae bacterium]